MKFRKKPVIVDAYQINHEEIIHTLEGDMKASPGDWIITGVNGEKYPFLKRLMSVLISILL